MPSIGWSFGTLVKRDAVVGPAKEIRHTVMSESKKFAAVLDDFFFGNFIRMAVLMLFILAVLVYISRRAARRFVEPVLALSAGVKDIAKGNLDRKLDIKTGDEIEGLANSVNEMTDDLKKYMDNLATATADKERIATELSLAQGIQEGMLPQIFPKFSNNPHFDLFASMEPAREVGGDFYDFYSLDDDHLALTIADVSGKGVPASLFMVISKTILKNAALSMGQAADLGHMMEISNRQLCENNEEMMFVTVFFGVLDVKTGEFSYVNAGHNAPYIGRTEDGHTEWSSLSDEKKNYMVGAVENAVYDERKITLKPGDMLFVYTDGVTEAMNENGELYTDERLEATLGRVATPDKNSETILAEVRADVAEHVGEAESSDDVTMLGIRYLGA
jgi:sigma-B regulation protein RsbU (phosphoserine phosphatase)